MGVGVGGDREFGGKGMYKIWKKGGLASLYQLCKETLKIAHPPIIKPPPCVIPHITAIFEKSQGWGGSDYALMGRRQVTAFLFSLLAHFSREDKELNAIMGSNEEV